MKNRKQKVVKNNKTSSSEVDIAGVPQGSIDGPLLCNFFINNIMISLFLYTIVLSNYADDKNPYSISNDKEETKRALAENSQTVINWLHENYKILNIEKRDYKDVDEHKTLQILSQKKGD